MLRHVLIGWCTIHVIIWFALAMLAFFIAWLIYQRRSERSPTGRHARRGGTRP